MTLNQTTNDKAAAHLRNPQSCISPDIPDGYDTMWSWWLREACGAFELLENPRQALREDEERLQRYCEQSGAEVLTVTPSPMAAALGLESERAYPAMMLDEFYPANP